MAKPIETPVVATVDRVAIDPTKKDTRLIALECAIYAYEGVRDAEKIAAAADVFFKFLKADGNG